MDKLIEKILQSLENGNILLLLGFIVMALAINADKIFTFLDSRKKLRLDCLKEAKENGEIDDLTDAYIKEEIAAEYFKLITGVYIENPKRDKLLNLRKTSNGELSFIRIKRALPHIIMDSGKLSVKIDRFDILFFWFNRVGSAILAFFGIFLLILPSLVQNSGFLQVITRMGFGFFLLTFAVFMFTQTFSVLSARLVEKFLSVQCDS